MENEEFLKCKNDIVYFVKYHIIQNKYNLYDYELKVLKELQKNNRILFSDDSKIDTSYLKTVFILWYAIFNDNKTICISDRTIISSKHQLDKIFNLYYELSDCIKNTVKMYKRHKTEEISLSNMYRFTNGSNIIITSENKYLDILGTQIDLLHINNFGLFDNGEIYYDNILPYAIVSEDSKVLISSGVYSHEQNVKENNMFTALFLSAIFEETNYNTISLDIQLKTNK